MLFEEKDFLDWYDNKEPNRPELPEYVLKDIIWGDLGEYIDTIHGENRRWYRTNTTYFKINDRYFAIEWEEGLTELQDNLYYEMPYEVKKIEYQKTITVTKWKKI